MITHCLTRKSEHVSRNDIRSSLSIESEFTERSRPIVVWDLDITDVMTTKCLSRTVKTIVIGYGRDRSPTPRQVRTERSPHALHRRPTTV